MIGKNRVLAIIPARGGSKRLPKKNVKQFIGKPLIAWSISSAQESKYIDELKISTDAQYIADVASVYGVEVPELRPEDLADDSTSSEDVLVYELSKEKKSPDILVLLQPTSPLRESKHIDEALELFVEKKAKSIISMTQCQKSKEYAYEVDDNGVIGDFIDSGASQPTDDKRVLYRRNGAIYIIDVEAFLETKRLSFESQTFAYFMNEEDSVDIDNECDFILAESLFENKLNRKYIQ